MEQKRVNRVNGFLQFYKINEEKGAVCSCVRTVYSKIIIMRIVKSFSYTFYFVLYDAVVIVVAGGGNDKSNGGKCAFALT